MANHYCLVFFYNNWRKKLRNCPPPRNLLSLFESKQFWGYETSYQNNNKPSDKSGQVASGAPGLDKNRIYTAQVWGGITSQTPEFKRFSQDINNLFTKGGVYPSGTLDTTLNLSAELRTRIVLEEQGTVKYLLWHWQGQSTVIMNTDKCESSHSSSGLNGKLKVMNMYSLISLLASGGNESWLWQFWYCGSYYTHNYIYLVASVVKWGLKYPPQSAYNLARWYTIDSQSWSWYV